MKNYQKILFPCAAAFVLSLSAFVSTNENSSLESTKEQSASGAKLLSANGSDVVTSSVTFNTTRTKFQVSSSSSVSIAENKVLNTLIGPETLDIDAIVSSYK